MDRRVDIVIEGRVTASVDDAAVERAKAKAAELEAVAKEAGEALSGLPEHLVQQLAGELSRLSEVLARFKELAAQTRDIPLVPQPKEESLTKEVPREAPREAVREVIKEVPREVPREVQRRPTLEELYARALGESHPLYQRVERGLIHVAAQTAGARTASDFARLEGRLSVLDRYLEAALNAGADPKAAERLREEIARLREEIERARRERGLPPTGGGGRGGPPGTGGEGEPPPEGGEGGGGGLPPWATVAVDYARKAAMGGLSRLGPVGAVLARLGPWGMVAGGLVALLGGVRLGANFLEGLNREARNEVEGLADLARLLEYERNPLGFFREPGSFYPDRRLLELGYTSRDALRYATLYGLPGGIRQDIRDILSFSRTTGIGEEAAIQAARTLGLIGIERGAVGQALEVLKAAMAEGVREGVDKASTLQGLLRLQQEAASRGIQATPTGLAFQAALQATLAGTGNRLLQGEMGANVQAALKTAFSGAGDPGLQMLLVRLLGRLPTAEELGLEGAAARGYTRLVAQDPGRAMRTALELLPERNPEMWARLVREGERVLGPLMAGLLESVGIRNEALLELYGGGLGSLAERAARQAPKMRQDLLEDPQARNRLAWESLQMDAGKRAIEEANQLGTLAATRDLEKAFRNLEAAAGRAAANLKKAFGEDLLGAGESYRGRVGAAVPLPGRSEAPSREEAARGAPFGATNLPAIEDRAARDAYLNRALREMGVSGITMGVGERYGADVRQRFPQLPERHQGLDVTYGDPRKPGDPVPSPFAGRVLRVGEDPKGYGRYVVLDVGGYEVRAGHLQEVKVQAGEVVRPGQVLGLEGKTGAATGPHTHWEIRQWDKRHGRRPVTDPERFMDLFYQLMRQQEKPGEPRGETPVERREVVVRIEGLDRIRVEGVSGPQADMLLEGLRMIAQAAVPPNWKGG